MEKTNLNFSLKLYRILLDEYTYFILLTQTMIKHRMIYLSFGSSSIHIREHFFNIVKFIQDQLPLLA